MNEVTIEHIKAAAEWAQTANSPTPIDGLTRFYDQGTWDCGTSCCIWGAANILAGNGPQSVGPPEDWGIDAKRKLLLALMNTSKSRPEQFLAIINANLSGADLSDADLSWADLSEAYLSGANLSGADLSWADLSEADLSGANLSWADLSWADLSEADLSGANLSEAYLSDADLSDADLSGANLSGAITKLGNQVVEIK